MADLETPFAEEDAEGGKDAPETKRLKDLLEQARADYKICDDLWSNNRKKWLEDAEFRIVGEGNQWPADIKAQRETDGLPCVEVDKLNQYVRQVVNDGRQNRPAVKVRPVDDGGDKEVAEALQGLVRHICVRSNADEAFDTALDHAAGCGYGFFRVLTEYASEKTFNQELCVRRVPNPLAVLTGPHELADGSDIKIAFFEDDIPKAEYQKRYPTAKAVNWESASYSDGWSSDSTVRVCEYWYKVEENAPLHLIEDGTTASQEDYDAAVKALAPGEPSPVIVETRAIPTCKVKWCRMSGAEILEERDWLGIYIPIIPVFGNETNIKGKTTYSGLVRPAKDAQRLHNYSRSAFAQRVALTTKAPWLIAEGQIEGYEEEWKNAHTGTVGALVYKSVDVDGKPIPPPQRISPSDIPAGFAQDAQMSEHDIQGALGIYNANLGEKSNEKSGRAIMARQREGDTATFHYMDNLNRAIRLLGRILVDAAPKYYDSKRVVRILGEDGSSTMAQIDPQQQEAVVRQGSQVIYNIGIGTYDVAVEAGPSYTTKRQESADAMIELTRANPTMWQTHGDLIVKSQDWPNADEFAKRSVLTLPPPIREAVEAEQEGGESEEVKQVKLMAQQAIGEKDQQLQQAMQALQEQQKEVEAAQQEAQAAKMREEAAAVDRNAKAANLVIERDNEEKQREIEWFKARTDRIKVEQTGASPEQVQTFVVDAIAQVGAQHGEALDAFQGAAGGAMQQIAEAIAQMAQGLQGLQQQVQALADDAAAPVSFDRDPSGRVNAVRKGSMVRAVSRGPDNRVNGVQ